MTQIKDLFSREIARDIKEVIKVDDRDSILQEVEEYVPTEHIAAEFEDVLEKYQDTINNPSEEINVWVSGFFGSGKSSFAKMLGYLLANPDLGGSSVMERFFQLHELPKMKALLNTIHAGAPTEAVLLDLNTTENLRSPDEPIVLPIYRTLLREFGYSHNEVLAELEFELEGSGELAAFEAKYQEVHGQSWDDQRGSILAKNRASQVLHALHPDTYPSPDSWSNSAPEVAISAKWFASRALALLKRRRPEKKRLVLIVDEVGQYVARSIDRLRHLQGLAEECQKTKGQLWLLATSQEKLTDVVDALGGKQQELARAQDRFPIKVDLLPSDIDEVTSKRVLDKTAAGASEIKQLLDTNRNKLTASVTLQAERYLPFTDDDFVRLYPLVPYQLAVLIDAVSARRAQGGAPMTMGGSNRTIIRHAQQLLSHPAVGLADSPAGTLVTLDRSYVLLEDVIPTAWRGEVDQVAAKHGEDSVEARIMRVVALCADVPGLKLTSRNLAAVLHPSTEADSIEPAVVDALGHLVAEDRVRDTDDGYRLQSPEQKDWEKTRRGIDTKLGDAKRLQRTILRDSLGALTATTKGRTFKVEVHAEREKQTDGDITLDIREDNDIDALRQASREAASKHTIFWAYEVDSDTWGALEELHRSDQMIERYDNPSANDAQKVLLADERKRRDNARRKAEQLIARDVVKGKYVFDGNVHDAPASELKTAAGQVVTGLVEKIYPQLDTFQGTYKKADVLAILQADGLDGLPDAVGPDGLGLFKIAAAGRELVVDNGPINAVVSWIKERRSYGEEQNGSRLEQHFGAPPFGATPEAVQATLAGAMRAGLIHVVSQAARITSATDQRLEGVFGNLPKFRAASFEIARESGPSLEVRGEVSEWLSPLAGKHLGLDLHDLAVAGRHTFGDLRQPGTETRSRLEGAGLVVPEVLTTMHELLGRVLSDDDELVVTTMHERGADLDAGRTAIPALAALLEDQLDVLKAAQRAVRTARDLTHTDATTWSHDLDELLQRARYGQDLAQIKSLTTTIEDDNTAEIEALRAAVESKVDYEIESLRSAYPSVADDAFDNAVGSLKSLIGATGLPALRSNVNAVVGVAQGAAQTLAVLATTKEVRHVRVTDVWSAPIASIEDLDTALTRVREAVIAELSDETEVRFQ